MRDENLKLTLNAYVNYGEYTINRLIGDYKSIMEGKYYVALMRRMMSRDKKNRRDREIHLV